MKEGEGEGGKEGRRVKRQVTVERGCCVTWLALSKIHSLWSTLEESVERKDDDYCTCTRQIGFEIGVR